MAGAIDPIQAGISPLRELSFERETPEAASATAGSFGASMTEAVDGLQQLQSDSNALAVGAVTGDLNDIHQATIASSRAQVTLQLMVAVRDKGVAAFNEIMRMQA
ncbi:flagellar hook-basal body complex protein FliE [Microbacterium suaedae]|uniref:flagellar hook-basal body complex protein FliE n=1 Tax=Microbacterium suaedae TaxID=2067813 RepID=UPI000DA1ED53|nr:flagellar hook-basal body complex protein FliE [Microbacterium suaedae]